MRMRAATTPPAMPAYRATFMEAARERAAEPPAPRDPSSSEQGASPWDRGMKGEAWWERDPPPAGPGMLFRHGDAHRDRGPRPLLPLLPGLLRLRGSPLLSARQFLLQRTPEPVSVPPPRTVQLAPGTALPTDRAGLQMPASCVLLPKERGNWTGLRQWEPRTGHAWSPQPPGQRAPKGGC